MCVKQTTRNTNSTTKIQPCPKKKNPPSKEIKNQSNSTHTCKTPKAKQCHQKKPKKTVWVYEESGLLSDGQTAGLCDTSNTEREL